MVGMSFSKNEAKRLSHVADNKRTMSSAGFSSPIDVWFWAIAIDTAVTKFADEMALECALRRHDEHIWHVRKSAEPEPDFFPNRRVLKARREMRFSSRPSPKSWRIVQGWRQQPRTEK